jgi:type II secretion system protein N
MRFAKRFRHKASGGTQSSQGLYCAAGFGLFLLGLLCSFYLAFPGAILKERMIHELETRLPVQVDIAEATLRPLLTLTGELMTIRLSGQPEALLQIDSFHIDPRWVGVLTGDPGLDGEIHTGAGELSFNWQSSGPLAAAADALPLDLPLATSPPTRLAGTLATAQVVTEVPLQKDTASRIDLSFSQVAVQGLEALTTNATGLRLGTLSLRLTGQGASFSVEQLETNGEDLVVSGDGTFMLVTAKPQNSRINLNLTVRAGSQADPTLASLLKLAGTQQSDGSRKLRLTGTLANPVIR